MGESIFSITAEFFMQANELTAISTALHPPRVWEQFVNGPYSILKCVHLETFLNYISNLYQNIKFTLEEEINGALVFLESL